MPMEKICTVRETCRLNEVTVSILLQADEMADETLAGQFVHIKCGEENLLRRPISVCDAENGLLRVVFEIKGEGTEWLAQRKAGDSLSVLGPLGHGYNFPRGKVLVAGGGIGVPPMLYAAKCADASVACLGFRSGERAILQEEFYASCDRVEIATDDGTLGRRGFVADLVEQVLTEDPEIAAVFACGPKIMLRTVAQAARRHNIPCQVSLEERMGCGIGACLVCACKDKEGHYRHVCKDGPVFPADEVDWDE